MKEELFDRNCSLPEENNNDRNQFFSRVRYEVLFVDDDHVLYPMYSRDILSGMRLMKIPRKSGKRGKECSHIERVHQIIKRKRVNRRIDLSE